MISFALYVRSKGVLSCAAQFSKTYQKQKPADHSAGFCFFRDLLTISENLSLHFHVYGAITSRSRAMMIGPLYF